MTDIPGQRSSSGVFLANDFRDNLIVDRYDPCFTVMRASKLKHLRSENSEDVVSWNVFRSLGKISPEVWLPLLTENTFPGQQLPQASDTTIELWKPVPPPQALLRDGDEGISEIDIVIENPRWVWFIEAKYNSDISKGTTTRHDRDQILRNIDVGSYYAGTRDFYFSLLIRSDGRSPKGVAAIEKYRDFKVIRRRLVHRFDGLQNLQAVGLLRWSALAGILEDASERTPKSDEIIFAERAVEWLRARGIKN